MPGWNPNMREVATGPSSSRGMQGAHSQLRRTIIAFTRPCDQSQALAHSILVVWTPSLHEKALGDPEGPIAAFICPRVLFASGDSRISRNELYFFTESCTLKDSTRATRAKKWCKCSNEVRFLHSAVLRSQRCADVSSRRNGRIDYSCSRRPSRACALVRGR